MKQSQNDITQLLLEIGSGNEEVAEQLWTKVYEELNQMAHRQLLGERKDHTLSTTALVHEAYLKLVDKERITWHNRSQFFAVACQSMRRILVDYARRRNAEKRQMQKNKVPLEAALEMAEAQSEDLLALDESLTRLAAIEARLGQVVEYRFFGGFSTRETAELMGISVRSVDRDWQRAKRSSRTRGHREGGVSNAGSAGHPGRVFLSMKQSQNDITQLLLEIGSGNEEVAEQLWTKVYEELNQMAHRQLLGERKDHTLSTTALVHEAYLKLVDKERITWHNRSQFFAVACQSMRRILVDYARRRNAEKRQMQKNKVPLEAALEMAEAQSEDLLALDESLTRLAAIEARLGQVVEYRFFGGFSTRETAELMGISVRSVDRDWQRAKAYLYRELRQNK